MVNQLNWEEAIELGVPRGLAKLILVETQSVQHKKPPEADSFIQETTGLLFANPKATSLLGRDSENGALITT